MPYPAILLALTVVTAPVALTGDSDAVLLCPEPTYCVVVQPIVVCDDAGQGPARMGIAESRIDRVYAKAGIDFHFLEPIRYACRKARDGEINLDQIVRESRQAGILRGEGTMINMFFVNAVDGHKGPLGRGQQDGCILFICLGDKPNRSMEAFVIAHEAGHNLNLRHAVDDEHVPNDVANLMGDGPFEQRVGPDGLTNYQIREIHKSRLVRKRMLCLDAEEARRAIVDESFEPYFSQLQRAEIAALTAAAPTAKTLDGCRRQARRRFQQAVLPFTERETEALSLLVKRLESRVRGRFPLLARQPWRFIKTANRLCGGFAWTRGLCIVLSQRRIDAIVAARDAGPKSDFLNKHGALLLHEQMHVLQRVFPSRFVSLYAGGFGLTQTDVDSCPWLTERQITNPDAVRLEWIFAAAGEDGRQQYFWPRTILRTIKGVPRMGRDFQVLAVEVQKAGADWRVQLQADGMPKHDPAALAVLEHRFPVRNGLDHPNEIAAYMFPRLVFGPAVDGRRPGARVATERDSRSPIEQRFANWCRANLQ